MYNEFIEIGLLGLPWDYLNSAIFLSYIKSSRDLNVITTVGHSLYISVVFLLKNYVKDC